MQSLDFKQSARDLPSLTFAAKTLLRRSRRLVCASALMLGAGAIAVGAISSPSLDAIAAQTSIAAKPATETLQRAMPASFADVVDKVSPAVVNIQVTARTTPTLTSGPAVPGNMQEFMERFFDAPGEGGKGMGQGMPQQRPQAPARVGAGSGFAIDAEGHIVTNEHVIHDAEEITVTFKDGTSAKAKLIGRDDKTDLALLKADVKGPVPFVEFGNSDDVRVGDWIVTVGNPFGLGHSVNVGVVSARGRTIGAGPYDDFLQIDAQINRGNSGGPAFDVHGNVVGVNAAIFSPNGGNVGIGFAIPAEMAQKVVADLMANGVVERGWLGVNIQPLNDEIAQSLGLEKAEGALVAQVNDDSPAEKAGLRAGDVIIAVGDERIEKLRELPRVIADITPGARQDLTVWRDGKPTALTVEIGRLPETDEAADAVPSDMPVEAEVGLAMKSLDPETAKQLGLDEGTSGVIVIAVKPGSPAAEKGLRRGDILTQAGGKPVASPADVNEQFAAAKRAGKASVLALVKRSGGQRFIALPVGAA